MFQKNELVLNTDSGNRIILPYGKYFGMASYYGKLSMGLECNNIEGTVSETLKPSGPLEKHLLTLWDGIRSAVSYSGYKTLTDAIGRGVFEERK